MDWLQDQPKTLAKYANKEGKVSLSKDLKEMQMSGKWVLEKGHKNDLHCQELDQ